MNPSALDDPLTRVNIEPTTATHAYHLLGRSGVEVVHGRLIGFATSHRDQHNHPGHEFAPVINAETNRRAHCNACRWFEVRIIREYEVELVDPDGPRDEPELRFVGYVVHTLGGSAVPNDTTYCRVARTESPYDVVELLTVRRDDTVALPGHSARALAQAAHYDDAVANAYVNRAVV